MRDGRCSHFRRIGVALFPLAFCSTGAAAEVKFHRFPKLAYESQEESPALAN